MTGTTLYIILIFTVLIQIALDTYAFSCLYIISQVLSVLILAGYLWFISSVSFGNSDLLGTGQEISQSPIALLMIFVVPLVLLCLHQAYAQYSSVFKPGLYEKIASITDDQLLVFKLNRLEMFAGNLAKLYRETSFTKSNLEEDAFELKKKSLHFHSEFIEAQYKDFYIYEYIKFYRWVIVILFALLVFWTLLEVFLFGGSLYYHIIRTLMCAGFLVIVLVIWTDFFMKYYTQITLTVIGLGLIIKFASEVAFSMPGALATGVIPSIAYILFNVDFEQISYLNLLNLSLYSISLSIYYIFSVNNQDFFEKLFNVLSFLILNFSISATSAFLGYYLERTRRLEYKLMTLEKIDVERSQRILSFLLPAFVKKRVKDGARYIAEDQGTVTILFCDIVDFDSICAEYSPQELTAFLDGLFQKFDQLCSAIGVTKIETVGKTYMACSGLKDSEAELDPSLREVSHARRAIELGLAMISLTNSIRLKSGFQLQVKIGINSGPVTAGVVGHHKPQFSLVGDTVNTSSRMCSTLESANSIQISKECYDLLESYNGLEFKANTIEAKGKGIMNTFIVTEAKSNTLQESGNRVGLSHLATMMQHSGISRTMTDSRIKKKSTELFVTLDLNEGFQRTDSQALGEVKLFDFSCSENEKQLKFRMKKTENDQHLMFSGVAIALVTFSLLLAISAAQYLIVNQSIFQVVIARGVIVLMLLGVIAVHSKIFTRRRFTFLMLFIFLCMIAVVLLDLIYSTGRANDLIALEVMYIILLLNHTSQIPLSKIIPAFLLIFIPWGVLGGFTSENKDEHAANAAFVIVFAVINASALYMIETRLRTYFSLREIAEKEISKTDKLLTQMMPPHVLENMRQDKAATDKFQEVTLLYADIVGFTAWSSNKTPIEVVGMLSEMFTRFDKKCLDHNVYKVHTIGDCYVVMGLTDASNRNTAQECLNVVQMAQSMIQIIKDINQENGSELNMRIGIHIGQVIAGITGTNIVRYDIYGPDVLMANKMESGGMAGRINVSDAARDVLQMYRPGVFEFELNKEIYAKVINQRRNCYFINQV
jgi:phospholipid-translocating ATPase